MLLLLVTIYTNDEPIELPHMRPAVAFCSHSSVLELAVAQATQQIIGRLSPAFSRLDRHLLLRGVRL
jgi:hypothetical protein